MIRNPEEVAPFIEAHQNKSEGELKNEISKRERAPRPTAESMNPDQVISLLKRHLFEIKILRQLLREKHSLVDSHSEWIPVYTLDERRIPNLAERVRLNESGCESHLSHYKTPPWLAMVREKLTRAGWELNVMETLHPGSVLSSPDEMRLDLCIRDPRV